MRLAEVALACAIGEAGRGVREIGVNAGPDVTAYLRNAGIAVPAAWCAAFVQAMADRAAALLGVPDPLNEVVRQALVADYVALATKKSWLTTTPHRGDLIAFRFGTPATRWNHIGFVMDTLPTGQIQTVEGNTDGSGGRDGDGVYLRLRTYDPARVCFIHWAG